MHFYWSGPFRAVCNFIILLFYYFLNFCRQLTIIDYLIIPQNERLTSAQAMSTIWWCISSKYIMGGNKMHHFRVIFNKLCGGCAPSLDLTSGREGNPFPIHLLVSLTFESWLRPCLRRYHISKAFS